MRSKSCLLHVLHPQSIAENTILSIQKAEQRFYHYNKTRPPNTRQISFFYNFHHSSNSVRNAFNHIKSRNTPFTTIRFFSFARISRIFVVMTIENAFDEKFEKTDVSNVIQFHDVAKTAHSKHSKTVFLLFERFVQFNIIYLNDVINSYCKKIAKSFVNLQII